jgi:hypothetical protein
LTPGARPKQEKLVLDQGARFFVRGIRNEEKRFYNLDRNS